MATTPDDAIALFQFCVGQVPRELPEEVPHGT